MEVEAGNESPREGMLVKRRIWGAGDRRGRREAEGFSRAVRGESHVMLS